MTLPEVHRAQRGYMFYPIAAPSLRSTEPIDAPDKQIVEHYFVGACDWFVAEVDVSTGLAFAFCCLGDPANAEWGYVSLVELESIRVEPGFVVDRDMHWQPCRFADVFHNCR